MSARTDALLPQSETGKINCLHRSPLGPVATRRAPDNVRTLWKFAAASCRVLPLRGACASSKPGPPIVGADAPRSRADPRRGACIPADDPGAQSLPIPQHSQSEKAARI